MRAFIPEYILVLIVPISLLLLSVKLLMILSFRQSSYVGAKLTKSFFYYDEKKIRRAEEPRLKRYYKLSNRVNSVFYSLITACFIFYTSFYVAEAIPKMKGSHMTVASDYSYNSNTNNNSLVQN